MFYKEIIYQYKIQEKKYKFAETENKFLKEKLKLIELKLVSFQLKIDKFGNNLIKRLNEESELARLKYENKMLRGAFLIPQLEFQSISQHSYDKLLNFNNVRINLYSEADQNKKRRFSWSSESLESKPQSNLVNNIGQFLNLILKISKNFSKKRNSKQGQRIKKLNTLQDFWNLKPKVEFLEFDNDKPLNHGNNILIIDELDKMKQTS